MGIQARFAVGECHTASPRAFTMLPVGIDADDANDQFLLTEKSKIVPILAEEYTKPHWNMSASLRRTSCASYVRNLPTGCGGNSPSSIES